MMAVADRLVGSVLRALDPETAHTTALRLMRMAAFGTPPIDDPALAVEAFGLRFPNPVGLAAGFDKNASLADAAFRFGFGFTEVGTLTPRPQPGNPRPRVFRLAKDHAVINRYGFNNDGHEAASRRLVRRQRSGILGVNVGANKESSDRVADYMAGVTRFAAVADFFTLNVSSPNTPGLRDLQGLQALDDLLARTLATRDSLVQRHGRKPLLLKIAPDLDLTALDDLVGVARRRGIDGLIVSNTTVNRPARLQSREGVETGGLSGRPLFDPSTRLLAESFIRVDGQFPLIGVGGIDSPSTALAKIRAGATLLQLYSGLVFQGLGLVGRIKQDLSRCVAGSRKSLSSQIGVDAHDWTRRPAADL
ncbi:quinone-dependent dihydroorotate dehydrogenase [Lichenifustis flavocetrariae]|uniref:Dihydroorotate dehydrogenase (quinone) n=1 Tax=Lichenifustis flavocetrariae TaxID=2949735 RepID=A0AA41Z1A4_9HYPH|nr:quinone-dependent dihydroorotate dehydrogenase [Lichenifustis flavocetrariae]MCW6511141.1 quinone-dependent dihydroorotate dehydrogenase [Lichenifustis flavocetrariae]